MLVSHKNAGDRLSISAHEWNEIAHSVNELSGTARQRRSRPLMARFECKIGHDDRTEFQPGDILAFIEDDKVLPLQGDPDFARVCFHDWCGRARYTMSLSPQPLYAMALRGGQHGSIVPVVASGIVSANLSSALDDYSADGMSYFGGARFAEVDMLGKLYPVAYQTSIEIISINLNTRRVLACLNCGVRPFGQFDTRVYPYEGKWRIMCYDSVGRYVHSSLGYDAGRVAGKGINGYVPSIDIDIPDIGSGLTVQYTATWERQDNDSPGQYTKHQLEIVSGTNSPHYAAGQYTEVIATVTHNGTSSKPYPLVTHRRPLGNILVPDITY